MAAGIGTSTIMVTVSWEMESTVEPSSCHHPERADAGNADREWTVCDVKREGQRRGDRYDGIGSR
jgi:hypothetical protein